MSHERATAMIKSAASGSEWRVLVDGSYRTTTASEHEAREWCRVRDIAVAEVVR